MLLATLGERVWGARDPLLVASAGARVDVREHVRCSCQTEQRLEGAAGHQGVGAAQRAELWRHEDVKPWATERTGDRVRDVVGLDGA